MASPRNTFAIIAEGLRQQIKAKQLTGRLPSEAQLMRDHGVSRTTARRALSSLQAEGLIVSVPGVGWEVGQPEDRRPLGEQLLGEFETLAVGDDFPSEAKLCEKFGVSRTAIRGALAQLEGNGLLRTVAGKPRRVCALPASNVTP